MRQICPDEAHRIDQVLARHLVVDAERRPAHRPIRLPLQLAMAARDRHLRQPARCRDPCRRSSPTATSRSTIGTCSTWPGRRRDRQEGTVGGAAFGPERRQDHVADRIVMLQHLEQRRVEAPGGVALGRREELVVEAERVEKCLQPRIVVMAEALMLAERIGHLRQRLAEMLGQHLLVGDVVGHLAQAVHVVGEADQPRRDLVLGEHAEGVAHHGGARDLAERADMRQARWPVAGLEDDGAGRLGDALQPAQDLSRLLERPGLADMGMRQQLGADLDLRRELGLRLGRQRRHARPWRDMLASSLRLGLAPLGGALAWSVGRGMSVVSILSR